jgi:hypothetical protein
MNQIQAALYGKGRLTGDHMNVESRVVAADASRAGPDERTLTCGRF